MRRRELIVGAAAALGASALRLKADHHTVSADPVVVEFDLSSLQGRYTRIEDFYVRNHYQVPEAAGATALQVEGQVDQAQMLTLADLNRLKQHTIGMVMECAGAPVATDSLISDGVWRGALLSDVISIAQPRPSGGHLHCFGRDGFARSVPMENAVACGLLATTLNDRPLTRNHGAPLRVVFPGWYGMNSVKWLQKIVVAEAPLPAVDDTYLELRTQPGGDVENTPLPRIKVKSIITAPLNNAVLPRGQALVRGLAWSGGARIASVEVRAGAQPTWIAAKLDHSDSRYDWTLWQTRVELSPTGLTELVCRATDEQGNSQPATREPGRIDSYSDNSYHTVRCLVVPG